MAVFIYEFSCCQFYFEFACCRCSDSPAFCILLVSGSGIYSLYKRIANQKTGHEVIIMQPFITIDSVSASGEYNHTCTQEIEDYGESHFYKTSL